LAVLARRVKATLGAHLLLLPIMPHRVAVEQVPLVQVLVLIPLLEMAVMV
jgi:hypothetical protein